MPATLTAPQTEGRILARRETAVSPWVRLIEKQVQFGPGQAAETYHFLAPKDYLCVLARTPDGRIPVVRQFRPAVEADTWEFPAGLVEEGEDPAEACRRELKEETGLDVLRLVNLGAFFADTGRLENRLHSFFAETSEPDPAFVPEPGMTVDFITFDHLKAMIRAGEFCMQLHLGVLFLHELHREAQAGARVRQSLKQPSS